MATDNQTHDVDVKTRANLAYIWSIALIVFVAFIIWQYGHILAVLTLIIGFITGTAATVLAVYFGAQITPKKSDGTVSIPSDGFDIKGTIDTTKSKTDETT